MEMIIREKGLLNIRIRIEQCRIDKTRDFHTLKNNERILLEAFFTKNGKFDNTIHLHLGDLLACLVKNAKSAHEVWSKLETSYETKSTTNKLIMKLTNLRMKDNECSARILR